MEWQQLIAGLWGLVLLSGVLSVLLASWIERDRD
jgi:Tfp pilus assembly protein PilW